VPITARFSKERCISLVVGGRPSRVAFKHDWSMWALLNVKKYSFETSLSKIRNLEHKYRTTKV
jgi:hypothetical protein